MKSYSILFLAIAFSAISACTTTKEVTKEEMEANNYQEVHGMLDVSQIDEKPEQLPMYPRGNVGVVNDIQKNVSYPASAKEAGVEGNVLVSFVVSEKGKVKDVSVLKGVNPELDKAAIEVIESLRPFTPAVMNGEKVDMTLKSLITFRLPLESTGTSTQ